MTWATDDNIVEYVSDIFDHGATSYVNELARSEADIKRKIKGEWWSLTRDPYQFDGSKLKGSDWKRATVYHALANYIFPSLANFTEDDTFMSMMSFYRNRFAEEYAEVSKAGIAYDSDGDSSYSSAETEYLDNQRLAR